jgi:hypothetical protein
MTKDKTEPTKKPVGVAKTPQALASSLTTILSNNVKLSLMIWGPPGVGKSSIVAQCADQCGLDLVDLRLSQLAPTDLRGLPVPVDNVCTWYPPDFLPREGQGILFLDEINMAPPAMQGIAQQLILDRKVGSYVVPDGWFVWAAGNRKEDKASVFDMPAPLSNRFVHLEVEPDFESFKLHALKTRIDERILAFLAYRTNLLHHFDQRNPAWPSPRTWMMASSLRAIGVPISSAVGTAAAIEFEAFESVYRKLPNLDAIAAGKKDAKFPEEPSVRYAVTIGLTIRASDPDRANNIMEWAGQEAPSEWFQVLASDILKNSREKGFGDSLVRKLVGNPEIKERLFAFRDLLFG